MFTKNARLFRLRFTGAGDTGGSAPATPAAQPAPAPAAPAQAAPAAPATGSEGDLGFPADTPVAEMTIEQEAAYWKHKARKHEKRARPADFDDTVADAEKWRAHQAANQSPDERAAQDARDAGRREGAASLLHDAVRAELRAARPNLTTEELDEFLEDVALDKFLGTDGRLDTDRVTRLAGKLAGAPEQGGDTPPAADPVSGGVVLGHVLGATTQPPAGNAGSVDEYRQREATRYAANKTTK